MTPNSGWWDQENADESDNHWHSLFDQEKKAPHSLDVSSCDRYKTTAVACESSSEEREREHIEKDEKKEKKQETGFSSGTTTRTTWEAVGHGTRCAGRVPRRRRSRPQQQRRRRDHSVEKGRFSCIHFPPVPPLNLRLSTHLPVPTRSHDTLWPREKKKKNKNTNQKEADREKKRRRWRPQKSNPTDRLVSGALRYLVIVSHHCRPASGFVVSVGHFHLHYGWP